tara:strand:+ start:3105 stop:4643 length:1539 start_codon:yes stop_codon:yes gene_type:complete
MNKKKSASILKKFLLFNFFVFSVLGLFTFLYLKAIQPSLVKNKAADHLKIIKNTSNHLERLNVNFIKEDINSFLLSTRFLFQSLDRVQFYNSNGIIVGDTDILDLDQGVFSKSDLIIQQEIDGLETSQNKINEKKEKAETSNNQNEEIKNIILNKIKNEPLIIEKKIKSNFFVKTLSKVTIEGKTKGYILVSEQANEILIAVQERKNFILRTVIAIALVIFIFSVFLNKYILKPIGFLVRYTESIKEKSEKPIELDKFFVREDEIGKLTKSINEMTSELQKRTNRAETFSTDLAHEIRNPLASLKGASELLNKTTKLEDSEKLFKIINHDAERIERLITDYSQMLKDEASLSREKMLKIDLNNVIKNVVEDFSQDITSQRKKIKINIHQKSDIKKFYILGIESRIEQVVANLLDNAISFSQENSSIEIDIGEEDKSFFILIKDEGPGFTEKNTENIFNRFYSNRPENFGEHSGLGLNIVKNIVELHKGKIIASNRKDLSAGAEMKVILPKSI